MHGFCDKKLDKNGNALRRKPCNIEIGLGWWLLEIARAGKDCERNKNF